MKVLEAINSLESIAPLQFASDWDNVGLLIGSSKWDANTILLTIDLTESVLREAIHCSVQMIVAYHPPIFEPLSNLTDVETKQRIVLEAARAKIAVYSPHTALDAAPGGVNDWIAAGLGDGDTRALEANACLPENEQYKIVTFCPEDDVERLRNTLAASGAGRIGNYELCSFELKGTGTFLAGKGTNPAIGKKGAIEKVDEVRLEMVCPKAALALAVTTIKQFHPYEEPPIEIYKLQARPQRSVGQGRRLVLDQKVSLNELVERIKNRLGVKQVRVALGENAPRRFRSIGLCAGAGGSLREEATQQGCQVFLTGEMRHHDVLAAQAAGCTVILAGHTNTERGYLKVLRKRLRRDLPNATVIISKKDSNPLRVM